MERQDLNFHVEENGSKQQITPQQKGWKWGSGSLKGHQSEILFLEIVLHVTFLFWNEGNLQMFLFMVYTFHSRSDASSGVFS